MTVEMPCQDCRVNTHELGEYFMIHDALWLRAVAVIWPDREPHGAGFLCVECLEDRLGRQLGPRDFTDAPCNFIFTKSRRLVERQFPWFMDRLSAGWEPFGVLVDSYPPSSP